jgi:ubiquinone biosynthesis protein COQ9
MARKTAKTAKRKTSSPKSATGQTGSVRDRMIDAALDEAAALGWVNLTLEGVAARAGLGLGEVLLEAPTRAHLLARALDRLDVRTLAPVARAATDESPRDRLFEILMRRFDLLNKRRDGVKAVIAGVPRDPGAALLAACRINRSAGALLGAAGISADGLRGFVRIQGLKAVMAYALRAWMTDDSADMAKTMAALDRALGRAEQFANFSFTRRRSAPEAEVLD